MSYACLIYVSTIALWDILSPMRSRWLNLFLYCLYLCIISGLAFLCWDLIYSLFLVFIDSFKAGLSHGFFIMVRTFESFFGKRGVICLLYFVVENSKRSLSVTFASNAFPIDTFYRITEVGDTCWIVHPPCVMIIILINTLSVSNIEYWVMVGYIRP